MRRRSKKKGKKFGAEMFAWLGRVACSKCARGPYDLHSRVAPPVSVSSKLSYQLACLPVAHSTLGSNQYLSPTDPTIRKRWLHGRIRVFFTICDTTSEEYSTVGTMKCLHGWDHRVMIYIECITHEHC